jgi:nucleoid-associated protein YgaU
VHAWTKSACVGLAWSILTIIIVVAVGMTGPARPVQANIRIASSTTQVTLASTLSAAAAPSLAAGPAARYVVQPGDTLSGIAARFAVRGGWPALYAANRPLIGPDPDLIRAGTVLVLPGQRAPVRYRVVPGDTLAAIAAALAVRGGWPALYAANRQIIGPDPDLIRPGTVLTVPRPAPPSRAASGPAPRRYPPEPSSGPAGSGHHPLPGRTGAPGGAGMPSWLKIVLLAAGLLVGAAFLAEPVLVIRRRRAATRAAADTAAPSTAAGPGQPPASGTPPAAGPARRQSAGPPATGRPRIVVADYARVVVTRSADDDTVYVLRPPGQDPAAIMRVARLVLPEGLYRDLAGQLGLPASWPIVLADYDRLVVTCSASDGSVCVLRPPGQDPAAVLKAARLVLPEDPYEELAELLGVSASWPLEQRCPVPPG